MACSDVDAAFHEGKLTPDGTSDPLTDPVLRILSPPGRDGRFTGRFDGDTARFTGQCHGNGPVSVIMFTRIHDNGTSTDYVGQVFRRPRENPVFIRGRFVRTTSDATTTLGDWETERPT